LKRQGKEVNHKKIAWMMKEMGLSQQIKRRKKRTTDSEHGYPRYPNLVAELEVTRVDQVWVCDITYIRLHQEFVYLAVIMDVFTRAIRGWNISRSLGQELTLVALQQALALRKPEIHHSDQGIQYAATGYTEMLTDAEIAISMADIGCPEQNGYAERLMRTIKEEEVDLSEYKDFADARQHIGRFLDGMYMKKRIHSSLGYMTPEEFELQLNDV
jgi:transposase InsO family protein